MTAMLTTILCLILILAVVGVGGFIVALKLGIIVQQAAKPRTLIPRTTRSTRGAKCVPRKGVVTENLSDDVA